MSVPLVPVILCGGSGTRLWPLSRRQYPKQFLPLVSARSMLQDTAIRASTLEDVQPALILCGEEHRFLVAEQMREAGTRFDSIVLEPAQRNTAPAVAVAAIAVQKSNPDAVMLVLPADHVILDLASFQAAVAVAVKAAAQGAIVTFGITPDRPETGYGYIEPGRKITEGCYRIERFVEKPSLEKAVSLVSTGLLWNSGMFALKPARYLEELSILTPEVGNAAQAAWDKRTSDRDFCRLDPEGFSACPAVSIDVAVMEKTSRAAVVPVEMGWSDVGSWASLWDTSAKDSCGNVLRGDVDVQDTRNSYLRSDSRLLSVTGMDDVVVVVTGDAVLVTRRDKTQAVKDVVSRLDAGMRSEHIVHRRVYRPWGYYECIDAGDGFQVKRLMVKPGEALSLQLHRRRAEHWVVVSGRARVTCGEVTIELERNQSTYIPVGTRHRLENPDDAPLYLIEVQSGDYLGEDDIVRFEDRYSRN